MQIYKKKLNIIGILLYFLLYMRSDPIRKPFFDAYPLFFTIFVCYYFLWHGF